MIIDLRVFERLSSAGAETPRVRGGSPLPCVSDSTKRIYPHNALISGSSGVGKTVLACHTLNRLEKHASVSRAHIRSLCKSTGAILREVIRQHPTDVSE